MIVLKRSKKSYTICFSINDMYYFFIDIEFIINICDTMG